MKTTRRGLLGLISGIAAVATLPQLPAPVLEGEVVPNSGQAADTDLMKALIRDVSRGWISNQEAMERLGG